jgi:predicted DCC family thiol-disulfide oxidoreductase YuxK
MSQSEEARAACRATIYYDGACPLCSLEIDHYRKQTGAEALQFVDVSGAAAATGDDLSKADALKRFHIRTSDGALVSGAAAFIEVWRQLPRWAWAARVAALPGVLPVLEVMYRGFLLVRPSISRTMRRLGIGKPHATG